MFQCTDAFVTLAAVELEKLVQFYAQLLDQKPQPYISNNYAEFRLPGLRLGIFKPRETHQPEFENSVLEGDKGNREDKFSLVSSNSSIRDETAVLSQGVQGGRGGMSLCLEVKDLEGAIAHLVAIGYPTSGEIIVASHGREIYAYDPAGNRLILHQGWVVGSKL